MKSILFVVNESQSANGICVENIMKKMLEYGFCVYCITGQEEKMPKNFIQNKIVYNTVKPRLTYRIFSWLKHKNMSKKKYKIIYDFNFILNKIKLILCIFSWPLISPLYSYRIYKKAKKICIDKNIDFIIPVYTQIDTLIIANKIKSQIPKIRYVPCFLDSLSGGSGPKCFSKEWSIKRGLKWESKLLSNADLIIMMKSSEEHHNLYSREYPYFSKISYLDIPLFTPLKDKKTNCDWLLKEKINLLYIGTIPIHIRNPKYFLEVFHLIKDPTLQLTIVGTNTCPEMMKEAFEKDNRIKLLPFISHEQALSAMQNADILINFGNNNENMTPSKIFEYISVQKPIITTAPIDNEPSLKYLKKYPASLIINESENDLNAVAKKLYEFIIKNRNRKVDITELEKDFYLNTPQAFIECIIKFDNEEVKNSN